MDRPLASAGATEARWKHRSGDAVDKTGRVRRADSQEIGSVFNDRSEKSNIFVMLADGTRVRQLGDTKRAVEWGPDWQPVP